MARQTIERRSQTPRENARVRSQMANRKPRRRWPALVALIALAAVVVVGYLTTGRDGGAVAVLRTSDFHALAFSSDDPNVVLFGHHNGVMRSEDGGRTWRRLVERPNFDAMSLAVSRTDSRRVYLAGHDVLHLSTDGGANWQPIAHNLPGADLHGFAVSPDDPNRLYAFVVGRGLFTSANGGRNWANLTSDLPADVTSLAAAGGSPETLYLGTVRSGLRRSTDGGRSWQPAANGLDSPAVATIAVDPTARQTVYAGVRGGLYKSTDGGGHWSKLPFPGENAAAVAVSPSHPNVVLAITVRGDDGVIYRSEDGGATWSARQ